MKPIKSKIKLKKSSIIEEVEDYNDFLLDENFDVDSRTVFLFGEIDEDTVLKCLKGFIILDKTEGDINLIINSEGGSTTDGWAAIDFIHQLKNQVHGIVYGSAFSMASVVLQACKTRTMTKHSMMLIHAGSTELQADTNVLISNAEYLKKDMEVTMDFYRSRARISPKKIKELMSQESFLDANQALKYGLIDRIL